MRFAAHPFEADGTEVETSWDPNTYMPPQAYGWSCSACALAWVLRATSLNPNATESSEIAEIGYCPTCAAGCGAGRARRRPHPRAS